MRVLHFLLLIYTLTILACQSNTKSKEVLFVCTHGAARSPIAAAYFNKFAKENNLKYHAVFRGTKPNKELTKETIRGLTTDGLDIQGWKPSKVSENDIEKASHIVTFGCHLPTKNMNADYYQWNDIPDISQDYNMARNEIRKNIEALIHSLNK